jgi:hypothetical protein
MTEKQERAYHRPVSMVVEGVRRMPDIAEIPVETQLTFNLKGDGKMALILIKEILVQIMAADFFAVEVTGRN